MNIFLHSSGSGWRVCFLELISETVPQRGQGWSRLPAHTAMNEIKPPELIECRGMQVSAAGEVYINLRQMCITGSYIVIIHTPQTSDLQSYGESLR